MNIGTWTLPVCYMPTNNIQVEGNLTLPCCCGMYITKHLVISCLEKLTTHSPILGSDCTDTFAFTNSTKLGKFKGQKKCKKAFPQAKFSTASTWLAPLSITFVCTAVAVLFTIWNPTPSNFPVDHGQWTQSGRWQGEKKEALMFERENSNFYI